NNPPPGDQSHRFDRLEEMMRSLNTESATRERLRAKYPSGYVLFAADHANAIIPYTANHFDDHEFDWRTARVVRVTADMVTVCPPAFRPKRGRPGITLQSNNTYELEKKPGVAVNLVTRREYGGGPGTRIVLEIVSVTDAGVIFLLGFQPVPAVTK